MSRFDVELMRQTDERIAEALPSRSTRMGTLVSQDAASPACTVRFDGSTVTTPVKRFSHVAANPGDRVGLQLFEGDWVVVGAFTA